MRRLLYLTPLLLLLYRPARTHAAEGCSVAAHRAISAAKAEFYRRFAKEHPKEYAKQRRHTLIRRAWNLECGPLEVETASFTGWLEETRETTDQFVELPDMVWSEIGDTERAQAGPGAEGEGDEDLGSGSNSGLRGMGSGLGGPILLGSGGVSIAGGGPDAPPVTPVLPGGPTGASEVPEPMTLMLVGTGIVFVGWRFTRRRA